MVDIVCAVCKFDERSVVLLGAASREYLIAFTVRIGG